MSNALLSNALLSNALLSNALLSNPYQNYKCQNYTITKTVQYMKILSDSIGLHVAGFDQL